MPGHARTPLDKYSKDPVLQRWARRRAVLSYQTAKPPTTAKSSQKPSKSQSAKWHTPRRGRGTPAVPVKFHAPCGMILGVAISKLEAANHTEGCSSPTSYSRLT